MNTIRKFFLINAKYSLSFAHKFVIGSLLFLSLVFFLNPQPYQNTMKDLPGTAELSFLQAGDYELSYELAFPTESNVLSISSPKTIDSNNQLGILIAQQIIEPGSTSGQLSFHLDQDIHFIDISTTAEHCLSSIKIQSVQLLFTDNYFMGLLCFLFSLFILFLGLYVNPGKYKMPLFAVCLGLLASFPLANALLIGGHDMGFHITRMESIYQGLRAGEFPVRIGSAQEGGFGSLSATMYPQLFLYPFALLRFARVSAMLCYKLLLVSIHIGTSLISYYSFKNVFRSDKIGILASVLYTFSLYRLVNIYLRSALGEALALTFLPLIIWGIYEVLWGNYKKWYLLTLGISAVLESHVLSFEMSIIFLVITVIFWSVTGPRKDFFKRIFSGIKAAGLTVLLNAFFLVPFLFFCTQDLQCFHCPDEIADSVLYLNQIFFSFAHNNGTDMPPITLAGDMPFSVGGILLIGSILFMISAPRKMSEAREYKIASYCLICGCFALFLTSWLVPWDRLSHIKFIDTFTSSLQFSWRFLGIACVLLSAVSAVGFKSFEENIVKSKFLYLVIAAVIFLTSTYYFEAMANESSQTINKMDINGSYNTDSMYMYYDGESFKHHHLNNTFSTAYIQSLNNSAEYSEIVHSGSSFSVIVTPTKITEHDILLFPVYYYPGYEISVNGEVIDSYPLNTRLACDMPLEKSKIEIRYVGLPIFHVGDIITLLTIIVSIFYLLYCRTRTLRKSPGN